MKKKETLIIFKNYKKTLKKTRILQLEKKNLGKRRKKLQKKEDISYINKETLKPESHSIFVF